MSRKEPSAPAGVQASTLWRELVSDGSASKSCLNPSSQNLNASTQLIDGKAAMMVVAGVLPNDGWSWSSS